MSIEFIKTVMSIKIAKCDTSLPSHYFSVNGNVFFLTKFFGSTALMDKDGYPHQDTEILKALVEKSKELGLMAVDGYCW